MTELTPEPRASEDVVPEGIRRARAAFLRDFPALMASRRTRGKYVCYHNEQCVLVMKDYFAMIREIVARNIPEGVFLILKVVPGEDIVERAFLEEAELP